MRRPHHRSLAWHYTGRLLGSEQPLLEACHAPNRCSGNHLPQDDVRYVSWGASPSWPFPEIYTTADSVGFSAQAVQWQRISNYSLLAYGSKLQISGVLTQYGACVETNQACTGVKNQPNDGYNQLWNSLQYLDSGVVAFTPGWLSDIHWWQ